MSHHSLRRDPALEGEHQDHKPYDQRDAGHLVMPDGSLVSSSDHAFLTAAAPYVFAAHMRARSTAAVAA